MTIVYNKFKYHNSFKSYNIITSNDQKNITFHNMYILLNLDFVGLFFIRKYPLTQKTLYTEDNIDHSENTVHIFYTDTTVCFMHIPTKTVYICSEMEYNEYLDNLDPASNSENEPSEYELAESNLISSTKIPLDNFIELMNNWHQLNLQKVPFALLYQNEQDWIACKGFETQEAMEAFVKQHSNEQSYN